nr:uncharacterized protein LOC115254706 [Aedes albopictus]
MKDPVIIELATPPPFIEHTSRVVLLKVTDPEKKREREVRIDDIGRINATKKQPSEPVTEPAEVGKQPGQEPRTQLHWTETEAANLDGITKVVGNSVFGLLTTMARVPPMW